MKFSITTTFKYVLLQALLLALIVPATLNANSFAAPSTPSEHILKGEVDDTAGSISGAQSLGIQFVQEGKTQWPARITRVIPGSPAAFRGLAEGDQILLMKTVGRTTNITIQRNGNVYTASLSDSMNVPVVAVSTPIFRAATATQAATSTSAGATNLLAAAQINQQQLQTLAQHDIVIIVDKSGSMGTEDCPDGLSRWEWCRQQTLDLSHQMAPYVKDGITLVVFSDYFTVYHHATMDQVSQVFQDNSPQGGTHTEDPLQDQLNEYFRRRGSQNAKPILIAVITDGAPNNPTAVEKAIIDASQRMQSPNEIGIEFFQIGQESEAGILLDHLDNELVRDGARYDIVQTKTFANLLSSGLTQAMVDAVKNKP